MGVILWLAAVPLWASALLVILLPTAIAMLGPVLVRRYVVLDRLTTNNEVAGFKFAVVGVVYAVLLGFAVIVVWEKFRDAETAVAQEAGAALTLYRIADAFAGGPDAAVATELEQAVAAYLREATERGLAGNGGGSSQPGGDGGGHASLRGDLDGPADGPDESALKSELLYQLDQLTQARRARLVMAGGVVPGVIWSVLFVGAAATVGFTFFFGTVNLRAQVLMTGLLALTILLGLDVILVVNRPFTGPVSVGAGAARKRAPRISRSSTHRIPERRAPAARSAGAALPRGIPYF